MKGSQAWSCYSHIFSHSFIKFFFAKGGKSSLHVYILAGNDAPYPTFSERAYLEGVLRSLPGSVGSEEEEGSARGEEGSPSKKSSANNNTP